MSIKNAAVSSVLSLMFLSLLVIYLISAPSMLITFLSVLIMLVGLIMAQSSSWRDIGILAAVAVIVSMVAIALVVSARLGSVGTVIALVLWGLLLFALFSSTRQSFIPLPGDRGDRAILIRNLFTGYVYRADGPIVGPNVPFMERVVAMIPLYELNSDVRVEKINTKRQNVDAVDVHIRYKVNDPVKAFAGIPNLGEALDSVAKDLKQEIDSARLDVTFWEKLLNRQMKIDTDEVVLEVIFDNRFAQNPVEVSASRQDLDQTVLDQLRMLVRRWGVELIGLRFERVEFNPEIRKSINKAGMREEETLDRKIEAERDATRIDLVLGAEVRAEAERVRAIIAALKESGVEITPDLVVKAITATSDWQMEGDFSLMTQQFPPTPPAPTPAKPADKPAEKK
jgi:regulator of protease activity HflC (stomatin/prohibitin superfamily)